MLFCNDFAVTRAGDPLVPCFRAVFNFAIIKSAVERFATLRRKNKTFHGS